MGNSYFHRVKYGETDMMGVLYHGHYLMIFEGARTDLLRENGLVYKDMEKMGVMMPVTDVQLKYLRPAFYDEVLEVVTTIPEVPGRRIEIHYEVLNEKKDLLVKGSVRLAFVNAKTFKSIEAPDFFKEVVARTVSNSTVSTEK